jgi:hypothetical protein
MLEFIGIVYLVIVLKKPKFYEQEAKLIHILLHMHASNLRSHLINPYSRKSQSTKI